MKPVLILTAAFGEGHNAAARNLKESLEALYPGHPVFIHDPFLEAYGWVNRLSQEAYKFVISRAPWAWQWVFDWLHETDVIQDSMGLFSPAARHLRHLVEKLQPGVIVSTYPGCNHLLEHCFPRSIARDWRVVTIVTDSITVNSVWSKSPSHYFIVANHPTREVMRHLGVAESRLQVLGFPVPRIFARLDEDPKPPLTLRRVLYVVNSAHHLAPGIVQSLLAVPDIDLTVTVGRDQSLGDKLKHVAQTKGKSLQVHGWTPEMPQLMRSHHLVISKAGGATVQESLAAGTPMIITQVVPGQEEGNAHLVCQHGAGRQAETAEAIASATEEAFANGGIVWQKWQTQAASLARPTAADDCATFIHNHCL